MQAIGSLDDIRREIRSFLADLYLDGDISGLEPSTPLVSSGIVDSTGVMEVVEFLERTYGIHIEDQDVRLENFDTLTSLADLVASKKAEA